MKACRWIAFCLVVLACSAPAWAQAVRIVSGGASGSDRRLKAAVPDFVATPGIEAAAREMAEAVAYDLAFTGLFVILPRSEFPSAFKGFPNDATQVDFDVWRPTKSDYLVYASVSQQGDALVAECRMFDVTNGTQLVGQRFQTQRDMPRLVAHRFSEEIVRYVDGVPGIATSRICFSGKTSNGNKEIFVSDYDGHNVKQLTKHASTSIKPKISPDGTKIAYLSYKDRYPFLYVWDIATGTSTPLSKHVGLNASPSWSPDGRMLAMTLSKDANSEIYIKNADGSGERRLTDDKATDTQPCFDPSGKQISFVSDRVGSPQICVMDVSGGNVRRISYQGGKAYDPVWSPNGKMIAYVAEKPGEGLEIYVMDATGGTWQRLTDSAGTNESPSWSADSRHVMFTSNRGGASALYAVNVHPPFEEHRIDTGGLACEGPSWGPRRQ